MLLRIQKTVSFLPLVLIVTVVVLEFFTCNLLRPVEAFGKIRKRRIVGGADALAGEYPFMVQVITDSDNKQFRCGGTIISPNLVLTSAHCVYDTKDLDPSRSQAIQAVAGALKWEWDTKMIRSPWAQIGHVEKVIINEKYQIVEGLPRNDLAVLVLSYSFNFTEFVSPIKLPEKDQPFSGSALALGWGQSSRNGLEIRNLKVTRISLVKCSLTYWEYNYDNYTTWCAGGSGQGPCTGDSGGPLVCSTDNASYVCGISSFGEGSECAVLPQGFVRVSAVADWIWSLMHEYSEPKGQILRSRDMVPISAVDSSQDSRYGIWIYVTGVIVGIVLLIEMALFLLITYASKTWCYKQYSRSRNYSVAPAKSAILTSFKPMHVPVTDV